MRRLNHVLKLAGFLGFLSIPHLANKFGANPNLFITWDKTISEFLSNPQHYLLSLLSTLTFGGIAVLISTIMGLIFGLLFAYFQKWLGFMETVMKFVWSVPLIVVAVYLNIFIDNSVIFVIITGVFLGIFPIISFVYHKAVESNDGILSLVATFNMSKRSEFLHLRMREIFKNISVALDQSIPLTYIGVTMGEYTVGGVAGTNTYGLGSDFQYGMTNSRYEIVYVSIILMVFLVYASGEASIIPYKIRKLIKQIRRFKVRRIALFISIICSVFFIIGCSEKSENKTRNELIMQLNWTDDPTFTGEYIAKERFWFLKKLNVVLKKGGIGIDPIAMILSKKADFAVVGADKALIAISTGKPIKIISVDLQRNPVGWIARRELKVISFNDIENRPELILGDKAGTEVSAILKLVLKRKKLNIVPKGVSFDFSYFLANKNSIYPVYLNEEPVKAEVIYHIPINEIDPSKPENGGIKLYGNVIITHADTIKTRLNIMKNFVSALNQGWEYARERPDEALETVLKYVHNEKEYVRRVMKRTINFATSMYGRPVPAGHMEYSAWESTIKTLRESGLLKGDVDLNEAIYLWKK